ncbi:hypothetical protein [Kocuria massiliensis]|uniref:hypothetical protein n=1 Tax=Kocuria massiliensis TaxID=1926282 RepID=UPI000A1C89E9|nr:hypothetical protein [Kocuria massiliensis]
MSEHGDAADDFFNESTNVAMMQAQRIVETMSRRIEQARRDREQQANEATRDTEQQIHERRDAARDRYTKVHQSQWWDSTPAPEMGRTFEEALAWRDQDPKARVACERIDSELQTRYGVSLADMERRLDQMRADRDREDFQRDQDQERGNQYDSESREKESEANTSENDADASTRATEAKSDRDQAETAWDSAESHEQRASFYDQHFDAETAESAKLADQAQAHPAREATKDAPATKSKSARGQAQSRSRVNRQEIER